MDKGFFVFLVFLFLCYSLALLLLGRSWGFRSASKGADSITGSAQHRIGESISSIRSTTSKLGAELQAFRGDESQSRKRIEGLISELREKTEASLDLIRNKHITTPYE